jgi:hypothetical protein
MGKPEALDAEDRRIARATWPVSVHRLDENADDISDVTTPAERIAMMWPLAQEAWRLAGRPIPDYDRAHTPCRAFLPGDPRPDDTEETIAAPAESITPETTRR